MKEWSRERKEEERGKPRRKEKARSRFVDQGRPKKQS